MLQSWLLVVLGSIEPSPLASTLPSSVDHAKLAPAMVWSLGVDGFGKIAGSAVPSATWKTPSTTWIVTFEVPFHARRSQVSPVPALPLPAVPAFTVEPQALQSRLPPMMSVLP